MENMTDSQEGSWRSQGFRQNVRAKIEEAIRQSGNPTTKSVSEMETHVFQKAKTREEYLGYVARLIIHVREMNSKKAMTGTVPPPNMGQAGVVNVGGGQQSDPMSALKRRPLNTDLEDHVDEPLDDTSEIELDKTLIGIENMPPPIVSTPTTNVKQLRIPKRKSSASARIADELSLGSRTRREILEKESLQIQKYREEEHEAKMREHEMKMTVLAAKLEYYQCMTKKANCSMAGQGSGGTVTIQSQPSQTQMTASLLGSGATISQMPTPPQSQPQIQVQCSGIPPAGNSPNVVTSSINPQGMSPMVMQQARFLGQGGVMPSQPVQQRPQMLAPNVQILQKFRQQGPPPNVTSTQIPMQGSYNENMFMQSQQSPLSTQFQRHSPAPATMANQGPNSNQPAVPSPAGLPQNMGPQMTQSPAVYNQSPNPQIAPSPAGSYSVRTPGAPSPGSALNTPIPSGPTPSPINRGGPTEESCYLEKRKQLSKYIEPLKKMIARIDKDENKKKDSNRMKNLLDILIDPNKRCPMDVLLKCEHVLEKMNPSFMQMDGTLPISQPAPFPQKTQEQNICQPLIDALNNISKSPMFNQILEKTFGPPITALFGPSVRVSTPPPKKRRIEEDSAEISDILQGEIARLDQKFKVQLDPVQHFGSKTVNIICQLDDKNLPCVPSICITVPDNYPDKPPQCYTTKDEYESTSILQNIQQVFSTRMNTMPQKYSITSLLDTWEMSVRQACASRPVAVES